jgi:S1-C subfamily serine protease
VPRQHRKNVNAISFGAVITFALCLHCPVAFAQHSSEDVPTVVRAAASSLVTITLRDIAGRNLGSGSGFVVTTDGEVVTNAHVIRMSGATEADARFQDGSSYQVQGVAALDIEHDLALIALKAVGHNFPALHLGSSDVVQVGQHVIAIGSPLAGLSSVNTDSTVSDGIVSGIRDWPDGKMKVFQVTAPLSPGSSGGALLSGSGEVIGVTFAQLREGQNLNFAVPISYAKPLLSDSGSLLRSITEVNASEALNSKNATPREDGIDGSYVGVWQSRKFSASGAATLTIKVSASDDSVSAQIFLTGGEVTSAPLRGIAHRTGENIWTVEISSSKPKLRVRGIFRGKSFVGDYTYNRSLLADHGQWILEKE